MRLLSLWMAWQGAEQSGPEENQATGQ